MKKKLFPGLHKIRVKLIAVVIAVLIVFLLLMTVFSSPLLFRAFCYKTYKTSKEIAESINQSSPGSVSYYFELSSLASGNNVSFEIVTPDGIISYTSAEGSAQGSAHFPGAGSYLSAYSSMRDVPGKKNMPDYENFEIKSRIGSNLEYFVYSKTLDTGEELHIFSSVADVESVVEVAAEVYSAISISIMVILTVIFCILVARFTRPLEEMNDITGDMAALNFSRKCKDYGDDEIGELGRSINTLSNTLDTTLMDLNYKNEQLKKDIERRHALDNARKSFISNVSHELKTPIAIISGYAEGLCEGISSDPEVIREYCQIIRDESSKMNSLVVELLELSKLDSDSVSFEPSEFDIGQRIVSLLSHLSLQLEQNGITVINNVPGHLLCFAQEDKIEIVLKNYITNALAHCSGSRKIILSSEKTGRCLKIKVFNTGEHISDSDLPEIWDSFYRADKAHGRSENRFGLGLSIVKSIMNNHKCAYGVENVENGVEFSFEVPEDSEYYEENKD